MACECCPCDKYDLPALNVHWHKVAVEHSRAFGKADNRGQTAMFVDAAGGIKEASAEKRATLDTRLEKMKSIMAQNPGRHWILWHHLEDERRAIEKALPEATSVYGSQDLDERERRILGFVRGEVEILATKPRIAGAGCNFQRHCYSNIFLGIDYKFADFIQAIHRTWRFLQNHPVEVHIIYAESEDHVVRELKRKWEQHNALVEKMRALEREVRLREYGNYCEAAYKAAVERCSEVER